MVVSFVYSHDVVSRLSIGSVRDIRNASVWMCDAHERTAGEEGWLEVIKRGRGWGEGKERGDNPTGRGTDSEWVRCSVLFCRSQFNNGTLIVR
jgi:hypothetical protein